jgi:glucosamine--fructose-6-phosphate aminotransferase (isomerizing)
VVGSGTNKVASDEIRIKLSELCYKTISSDIIEDKKHIDLSSEPLVFVCAAGLPRGVVPDAVKEVAVFHAHRAAPIVVCDRGDSRFAECALVTIEVPPASPHVAVILNALVGHLFACECARAVNGLATPLRRARSVAETARKELGGSGESEPSGAGVDGTRRRYFCSLAPPAREAIDACRRGRWNSSVEPGLAVRISQLLRVVVRPGGDEATPQAPGRTFDGLLAHTIEELTSGIDAMSHPPEGSRQLRAETSGALSPGRDRGPPSPPAPSPRLFWMPACRCLAWPTRMRPRSSPSRRRSPPSGE